MYRLALLRLSKLELPVWFFGKTERNRNCGFMHLSNSYDLWNMQLCFAAFALNVNDILADLALLSSITVLFNPELDILLAWKL